MRNITLFVLVGISLLAFVGAAFVYAAHLAGQQPEAGGEQFEEQLLSTLEANLQRQEAAVERLTAAFEEIDDLKTAQETQLRRFRNADHLAHARSRGFRVSEEEEADRLSEEGRLVELSDNRYYYLQEFDYSVPYVTPDAARLLEMIGERLHEQLAERGLPAYRFNISSVLRTAENQQALRQINPNATYGVSTHEFGTTVDIVFHIYDYFPRPEDVLAATDHQSLDRHLEAMRIRQYDALGMRYWRMLRGMLGRILIDLQSEGKVMVTLERQQPVFHITVSDNLAQESG